MEKRRKYRGKRLGEYRSSCQGIKWVSIWIWRCGESIPCRVFTFTLVSKRFIYGRRKNKEIKELFFKITENGFERLKSLQEVKAKPQTVVVGTEVEKLEAKNFVEVKDGEVIGFVEKPTTSKVGEQKVKSRNERSFWK